MRIDRKLNLVIPVETDGTISAYVHSMPISTEVFGAYFLPLSKTFASIYQEGLGPVAGPRVAALMLKKISQDLGQWEGDGGVERGLLAEIYRLTNVVAPDGNGWGTYPYREAINRGLLSSDDAMEVENAIVFFTLVSTMHRRPDQKAVLDGAGQLWGSRTESLNCTEFAASLPTSKPVESSGVTMPASSVPV